METVTQENNVETKKDTFTQDELNSIVNDRLKRERAKYEDYEELKYFPSVLSPTIQTTYETDEGVKRPSFAGLTDASVSTEDQGDIDRSNLVYKPDITYHLQELLSRTNLTDASDADIWLLTIHTEKVADANGSLYDND